MKLYYRVFLGGRAVHEKQLKHTDLYFQNPQEAPHTFSLSNLDVIGLVLISNLFPLLQPELQSGFAFFCYQCFVCSCSVEGVPSSSCWRSKAAPRSMGALQWMGVVNKGDEIKHSHNRGKALHFDNTNDSPGM